MADFSRPGSLYGAIDLGARKQALEAQARREAAGPQAASASVVEVTEETFTTDVVDRSMQVPVVLDLWSPRAPASAQLGPVLEKVVGDLGGRAVLARVNVDASPQIAAALRVQAVPTVLAIFQGQAVTGFQQVLPEQEVRRWLDELMAAVEQFYQANPGARPPGAEGEEEGPAGPPADPDLAAAEEAVERGDLDAAAAAYQRLLARAPGNEDAKMGLAGVTLIKRTEGVDPADVERRLGDPADLDAHLLAADLEMLSGQVDEAFARVIAVVKRTSGDDRDRARKHLLGLFDTLPSDDPSLAKARRALASALF
ncbi:tetratricopeptide repeat protein [Actinomadura sp. ATCC 31491]|uniref:Tetratricopeptide repeat protein n=1 Tax=Actinomadura luzonensis TaxID=2805427 RepID=A0ABT0GB98_9ACTN|nr:tetratricopeptide repeat protein [Actinomadura luzonensis]MCK2221673.1 tetratricopeptide repeat protein [Actinomadura luzonensis]